MMQQPEQTSLKDIDFKYYLQHYLRLFWKWKWYSLLAGPIAGAIAVFAVLQLGLLEHPSLTATVFIGTNSSKARLNDNLGASGQNKERMLFSRSFLQHVVNKLSLQLAVTGQSRYELFDSLQVDSTAPLGSFNFVVDKENNDVYRMLFSNKSANIKDKIVESGNLSALEHLNFSGIYLKLTESFLKDPKDFSFSIIPMKYAIDKIINKMKVTSPDQREQIFYYSITLGGTDYPLVAQTLNVIADLFVETNATMQKRFVKETIAEMERQLAAAEQQQSQSKNELRNFLAQNPGAGLSQSTQQTMTELISLETGTYESKNSIDELQTLKEKFNNAHKDEKLQVVNEMIVFLQSHGSLAAPALQANLAQFTQEQASAQQNYAKSHPVFAEIEGKFASLNSRALQAIDSYIAQLKKASTDRNYSIQKITSKLQSLPSKELKFAELQKRESFDSDIYNKMQAKYNELKVFETVGNADIFLMEYAVPPDTPSSMQQKAKSAGIILAAVLLFAFGPAVGLDFLDKTARTEQTLTKMLPYRFLETIPLIKMPKQKNPLPNTKRDMAVLVREILINQPGIQPPSAIELFRSLATKVLLDYYEVPDKSFVVTSFEMDEGKSTVAANLAISLAEHGVKTVIIDCDLRRGVTHKILSLNKTPGLSDYLLNVSTAAQPSSIPLPLQQTSVANLWAIPSGAIDQNPQRLLRSPALASLKERLQQESFFVIFDSPPIAVAADTAILSNLVYKYLLVVRAGRTNVVSLRKILKKDYPMIDKKILGIVLNMGENTIPSRYYSYYYNNNLKRSRSDT